jgi:hypothetical protein
VNLHREVSGWFVFRNLVRNLGREAAGFAGRSSAKREADCGDFLSWGERIKGEGERLTNIHHGGAKTPRHKEFSGFPCAFALKSSSLPKAVLKSPQSKRCRACPASSNFAKRLDCGAFTALFGRVSPLRFHLTGLISNVPSAASAALKSFVSQALAFASPLR